jgi:tetratricopeptide (TPR) repeat protein
VKTAGSATLLEEAIRAGRQRDYARAAELCLRAVGSPDSPPQALLYLGRSYHALGDHARAAQAFQSFLRQRPGSVPGLFFLGRSFIALGEYGRAVRALRLAVEKAPGFAAGHGLLGLASVKAHRPDKAIWSFARALEIDPQNARLQVGYLNTALILGIRLFNRGDSQDAERLFTEVAGQRPRSILPHLYLSTIMTERGAYKPALEHLEAAIQLSPQDPFLHLQKANLYLLMGQKPAAEAEIKAGSIILQTSVMPRQAPEDVARFMTVNLYRQKRWRECVFHGTRLLRSSYADPQVHALVGESYRNLGELTKAKNHYLRAIERDKASVELRYGLMAVLWERGEHEELLRETARVLSREPPDGDGRYFHSLALSRTGAAADETLAALQQQVKARGPDPLLMAELGAAYARAGLPELAEGWLERALRVSPPSTDTLQGLADVYAALGKRDKLPDVFRRYLSIAPADRAVRRRFVRLLLELDDFSGAAEQISALLPVEPDNARLKATLAVCYRRTGRYADALVLLKDLLSDAPSEAEHLKAAVYCLDRMGSRGTAVRVLEGFMRQNGDSLPLLLMLGVLRFQEGSLEKATSAFRAALSIEPRDWRANRNLGMVYRRMGNETFAEKFLQKARDYRARSAAAE